MRGLASVRPGDAPRLRRWDAVVLGGALPGLVAAIRLGQRGARVLVIEERAAREAFFGLREPFALTGWDAQGVLGACLRELALPLIERRRLVEDEVAVQIATPDARIDFGRAPLALAELTAWGLLEEKPAGELLEACERAARKERDALLAAPIVKALRRRWPRGAGARGASPGGEPAGPVSAARLPDALRPALAGLCRALSGPGAPDPTDAAIARRVGGLLSGAARLVPEQSGLRGLLRRRIEALLGEFRTSGGPLELMAVGGQPAVGLQDPPETCAGKALLLNAPLAAIANACGRRAPPALRATEPTHRRVQLHYRGEARALPEGMRERVVCVSRPDASDARAVVSLKLFPTGEGGEIHLVASTDAPASARGGAEAEAWVRRTVRDLAPLSAADLEPVSDPVAWWDHDLLACDSPPSRHPPRPVDLRLAQRPPVFALPRDALAPLGLDGDLLLGWRAGDALAETLA